MHHRLALVRALLAAALVLQLAACSDGGEPNTDENRSPVLDGFDSGSEPSPCSGEPVNGAACSLPDGAFCSTVATCACYPTRRTLACECRGGTWSCPDACGNEQLPCPDLDVDEPDAIDDDLSDATADMLPDTAEPDTTEPDSTEPDSTEPDTTGPEPALTASNQTLSDLSTRVTVAQVEALVPGFLVISAGGTTLGHEPVPAGTSQSVVVELDAPLASGASMTARLHVDAGQSGVYEPALDVAATTSSGQAVAATFTATVPAGTPAVRLRASASAGQPWMFGATEPSSIASVGTGQNPTVTLREGWRYELVNESTARLLELVDSSDQPLLSETVDGSLEQDAAVDWVDSGDGVLRFTVAPSLAQAVSGYRDAGEGEVGGAITVIAP